MGGLCRLGGGSWQALARDCRSEEQRQQAPAAAAAAGGGRPSRRAGRVAAGRLALAALLASYPLARRPRGGGAASPALAAAPQRPPAPRPRRATARRAAGEAGAEAEAAAADAAEEEDWRAFRARLVRRSRRPGWLEAQEQASEAADERRAPGQKGAAASSSGGWVHATPLIEQGSVLLARAGDHFAVGQPYFHKAVILIVEHSEEDGDAGVILNRPMSAQLEANGVGWPMWFGGPCSSLDVQEKDQSLWCLHTNARLADISEPVIRKVFIASLEDARAAVRDGLASPDDFMLVCGYCGWSPGQLQEELDYGTCWTMAAADAGAMLGSLQRHQRALRRALRAGGGGCSGAGLALWRRLYRRLGARPSPYGESGGDAHSDSVLRLWSRDRLGMGAEEPFRWGQRLLRRRARAEAARGSAELSMPSTGTILVASASAFVLGVPDFGDRVSGLSLQYLHKGVLGLLSASEEEGRSAVAVLLNGPLLQSSGPLADVYFGGDDQEDVITTAFGRSFLGSVIFPPGMLSELLHMGALSVARGVEPAGEGDAKDAAGRRILDLPAESRWSAAGGSVGRGEGEEAALGDKQRHLWFQSFFEQLESWEMDDLDFDDADLE